MFCIGKFVGKKKNLVTGSTSTSFDEAHGIPGGHALTVVTVTDLTCGFGKERLELGSHISLDMLGNPEVL